MRLSSDSLGFEGSENLNTSVVKNTSRLFSLSNNLALQYRIPRSVFLFLSNLNFSVSDETNFERSGFFHLRYGFRQNRWLTYEVFSQYQINIPLRIQARALNGAGARFGLINKEKNKLYTGHLMMYEYDNELDSETINRDVRLSSYLTYELKGKNKFSWSTVVYYQPRLDKFADFRVSGQTQLKFRLIKSLFFIFTGSLSYDAFPVDDPAIPNLTYKLTNGLRYEF